MMPLQRPNWYYDVLVANQTGVRKKRLFVVESIMAMNFAIYIYIVLQLKT